MASSSAAPGVAAGTISLSATRLPTCTPKMSSHTELCGQVVRLSSGSCYSLRLRWYASTKVIIT